MKATVTTSTGRKVEFSIPRSAWKLIENARDESVAVCTKGPFEGMEIAVDWSQGWIMPPTKKERLASIVEDRDLVSRHLALFLGLEE